MWFAEDDLLPPARPTVTALDVQLAHARVMVAFHHALMDVLYRPRARSRRQTFPEL
jgi:hypothetical protein